MPDVISYDAALKQIGAKSCSLLLGNGFSADYCGYQTLLERSGLADDAPSRVLFDKLNTVNFERVVRALEDASVVEYAYGREEQSKALIADAMIVRKALVTAVRNAHPPHRDDIKDVIPNCIEFLTPFSRIFTTNYDLLLYWVIVGSSRFGDGFYSAAESEGFRGPFQEDGRCNVYNLHGGLHLFLRDDVEIEKRLAGADGGIDAIAQTISEQNRFPIYVAEGSTEAKQKRIATVSYLKHCFRRLQESNGCFFVYGHSADEMDAHVYNALFSSKISRLYFCVFDQTKLAELDGRLANYQKSNKSVTGYTFVDSTTAGVWG
jgi:hypothetical protein